MVKKIPLAVSTAAPNSPTHILGGLEVAWVVRDVEPIEASPDGFLTTLGQMIDNTMAKAISEHKYIQDIAFHFDTTDPQVMKALRDMYDKHPIYDETGNNYG